MKVRRLVATIVPRRYLLELDVDLAAFTFTAMQQVEFELLDPGRSLVWHADGLDISNAKLDGQAVAITYQPQAQTVTFEVGTEVTTGSHVLTLQFAAAIQDSLHGFYRSRYEAKGQMKWLATTQFEAIHAREAFVCIDEPAAKAIFELTIITADKLCVLSNTEATVTKLTSGRQKAAFAPTPIMSTYLLAYVIGGLEAVSTTSVEGIMIRAFTTPGQQPQLAYALDIAAKCLSYYNDYFDIRYPLTKLDLVAMPDFAAGAMENWGLVIFRETDLLIDSSKSSLANRQRVAVVIAHELAHQWFGNLVTMAWWNDLWLNESFASWAETVTLSHLFPEWQSWDEFATGLGANAMRLDELAHTHPVEVAVPDPAGLDEIFDSISYFKGQALLRMLAEYLGDEVFRNGLRAYLSSHAYANATTADLWEALGAASGQPVADIMAGWTRQPGFPVLTVDLDGAWIRLGQARFFASPSEGASASSNMWEIPLTVLPNDLGVSTRQLVSGQKVSWRTSIEADDWIKFNAGQTGFYRVNYGPELNSRLLSAFANMPPIDRYGVVSDRFALAKAGLADTVSALELARAAAEATDYPTWIAIIDGLRSVIGLYEPGSTLRTVLEQFGRDLLPTILNRLHWEGYDEDAFTTLLRPVVLAAAGDWGDETVINEAKQRFGTVLDPNLEGVVYSIIAAEATTDDYDKLRSLYRETHQPQAKTRLRYALSAVRTLKLIAETLEFALSDEVRAQDCVALLGAMLTNPVAAEAAWQFIGKNWDELERRYAGGGQMLDRLPLYAASAFHTETKAVEVEQFFLQAHPSPTTKRPTEQAIERIRLKAAWIARDSAVLAGWLEQANGRDARIKP